MSLSSDDPILTGGDSDRSFAIFEPYRTKFSMGCRVVIQEGSELLWEQVIYGESRSNAIHCAIRSLDGFFDNLLLRPASVAEAMDDFANF